ncbi:MAG: DUF4255 domain-containing protein [Clostridia bacterium]|nr:DUF4255 domain-containing protein [Clostridia bacterium]
MADYTALYEAGNALVELLREQLTPEPISKGELISLCSPHESENNQLTVWLFHIEEEAQSGLGGYYVHSRDMEKARPTALTASFLITAHSKAPVQMRQADQYRMMGAAIQAVKDMPVMDKRFLSGSLALSGEELHLYVERPNFDQLIKIWNNTSSAYKLSIVVRVSGISIESKRTRRIRRVTDVTIETGKPQQG